MLDTPRFKVMFDELTRSTWTPWGPFDEIKITMKVTKKRDGGQVEVVEHSKTSTDNGKFQGVVTDSSGRRLVWVMDFCSALSKEGSALLSTTTFPGVA